MSIKKIVAEYLKANGYDGLYNKNVECGCNLEQLMACGAPNEEDCVPGYKAKCDGGCNEWDYCISHNGECPMGDEQ